MAININTNDFSSQAFLNSLQTMQPYSVLKDQNGKLYYVRPGGGVSTINSPEQYQQLKQQFQFPAEGTFAGAPSGYGGTTPTITPNTTSPTSAPPSAPSGYTTVYWPDGSTQQVPTGDTEYWRGQGWSTSPPANTSTEMDYSAVPKEILASPGWTQLSTQQKNVILLMYKGLTSGDAAAKADAAKALEDAKRLADPYYKGLVSLAQDEFNRNTISTSADAASRVTQLRQKIDQINQDLTLSREDLTIDERADLAAIKRQYEDDLDQTQTMMVESGLTFSSPRAEAERKLATQSDELAQSTTRKYARQKRDNELAAQRAQLLASQDITDTERKANEIRTAQARETEAKVGTSNLPSSATSLGTPLTGSIEQDRQAKILELEKSLLARTAPLPL